MSIPDLIATCNSTLQTSIGTIVKRKDINDIFISKAIQYGGQENELSVMLSYCNNMDSLDVWKNNMVDHVIPFINNKN